MTEKQKTVSDVLIAGLRTLVPVIVGYILAWFAQIGLGVTPGTSASLELLLTAVLSTGYHALVTVLQKRYKWVGWLLGYPLTPTYGAAPAPERDAGRFAG